MKIGVLGTGMVGDTISSKLVAAGHEVKMGSRTAANEKAAAWAKKAGAKASHGTFADAAAFGELLVNCTSGSGSIEALTAAGEKNLEGKVLIDISNPLDFSKGMPPTLSVSNDDSLGERIQKAFPKLRVVKSLNTMNCQIMVDPSRVAGDHTVFVSGNDAEAKKAVRGILTESFRWKSENILDLGDITTARGTEMWLPLWLRIWGATGTGDFNLNIVRAKA